MASAYWSSFSRYVEPISESRFLRLFLLVLVLAIAAFGSYEIGRQPSTLQSQATGNLDSHIVRQRREANRSAQAAERVAYGGAVYTRWGRTECPLGSDVVYSGTAGGSNYDSFGGGSNYLCLPMDPIWAVYNEAVEKDGKIYGSEFESPSGISLQNMEGRPAHDQNVPCVVCRSQRKTSVVMIPARNLCYDGWNAEYSGYLMSGHPVHKGRFEFVCMDGSPEADPAGSRNEDGALFYNVEGVCGSLPCPPYIQRREFTCVVCSK